MARENLKEKKLINKELISTELQPYDIENEILEYYKNLYPEKFKDFTDLNIYTYIVGDDYRGTHIEVTISGNRLETDAEFETRVESNKKRAATNRANAKKKKELEYAEYLKLKEKYEKESK